MPSAFCARSDTLTGHFLVPIPRLGHTVPTRVLPKQNVAGSNPVSRSKSAHSLVKCPSNRGARRFSRLALMPPTHSNWTTASPSATPCDNCRMSFVRDLLRSRYGSFSGLPGTRAVGWLSASEPYAKGALDEECLLRLRGLHSALRDRHYDPMVPAVTVGGHLCELCIAEGRPPHGEQLELYVRDPVRGGYEAPAMLLHYIDAHGYRPPKAFVRAVIAASSVEGLIEAQRGACADALRRHEIRMAKWDREHPPQSFEPVPHLSRRARRRLKSEQHESSSTPS